MQKRTLEELNLIDDFLFNKMISHPEFGEEFARDLIRIILGKEVGKLKVIPQKVYYGSDTDTHGARLDVYLEELEVSVLENATIYDVEPESESKNISLEGLARRVRFYHSKIDSASLKAGTDYQTLKNVVVIFIMPKDPLGANRMVYTIESKCKELPDLPYEDGAKTIFLYTRGTEGNPTEELKELLSYMENSCEENAKNDMLKKMHQMMRHVKSNEEVSIEYMKIFEREKMIRDEGREEQARENARKFFENGAGYDLVRASITLLSDEELQAIYQEVKGVKQ
jgi:predicted transposase/invertase (TIGR01784 family)